MINMKSNEKQSATLLSEAQSNEPDYPYGLRISLDEESLKKLGITDLPEVGQAMTLQARVEVVSVSQYEHTEGKSRDMSLQITDMALDTPDNKQQWYPNSDMS